MSDEFGNNNNAFTTIIIHDQAEHLADKGIENSKLNRKNKELAGNNAKLEQAIQKKNQELEFMHQLLDEWISSQQAYKELAMEYGKELGKNDDDIKEEAKSRRITYMLKIKTDIEYRKKLKLREKAPKLRDIDTVITPEVKKINPNL